MMTSLHYAEQRQQREALIKEIGEGKIVKTVTIDRGHHNGPEIHKISDTGIITIFNKRTRKLVTKLVARPGQIRRYFKKGEAPQNLIEIAMEHQKLAYNVA